MKETLTFLYLIASILFINSVFSQNFGEFNNTDFPAHLIDKSIIEKRNLYSKIYQLENECNWGERIGKKVDVFWLKSDTGNFFGHVYEYFMDCDNLRLIYWYHEHPSQYGQIVDFFIENLEDDSVYVTSDKKHLKNKRKYQKFLLNLR